jgi:hypothetical protein
MPLPGLTVIKSGTLPPIVLSYQGQSWTGSNAASHTFSGMSIGTATGDRKVIVGYSTLASGASNITQVVVGGITASLALQVSDPFFDQYRLGLAIAAVPTGTAADITIVSSGTVFHMAVGVWSGTNIRSVTPVATTSNGADVLDDTHNMSLAVRAGGAIVALQHDSQNGVTRSWTGVTERYDLAGTENNGQSGASLAFAAAQTVNMTCVRSSAASDVGTAIAASWR